MPCRGRVRLEHTEDLLARDQGAWDLPGRHARLPKLVGTPNPPTWLNGFCPVMSAIREWAAGRGIAPELAPSLQDWGRETAISEKWPARKSLGGDCGRSGRHYFFRSQFVLPPYAGV